MVGMGIVLKLLVLLFACLSPAFGFTGFLTCKSLFEGVCTDAEKKAGHVCIERQVHTYRSKIREFHNECENLKGHLVDAPKVKGRAKCQGLYGRLPDTLLGREEWEDLTTLLEAVRVMDNVRHPVVLISVSSIPCKTGCCNVDLFVRPGTTDVDVVWQLFVHNDDEFLYDINWTPSTILDAGGNVGIATILFAHLFPEATIVVIEPDPSNFAVLQLNTIRYGNVFRENRGLWSSEVGLNVVGSKGSWGSQVQEVPLGQKADLQATTVKALMQKYNLSGFDYAKIDIEGAEIAVFGKSPKNDREWMKHVRMFSVETHDWFMPGSHAPVVAAMAATGKKFKKSVSGEYHVWTLSE